MENIKMIIENQNILENDKYYDIFANWKCKIKYH